MRWDLLEEAAQYAAEHPEHFDMEVFRQHNGEKGLPSVYLTEDNKPACGTSACLAGTVVWMNRPDSFNTDSYGSIEFTAYEILGIEEEDDETYREINDLISSLFFETELINHKNVVEVVQICKSQGLEGFEEWRKQQRRQQEI